MKRGFQTKLLLGCVLFLISTGLRAQGDLSYLKANYDLFRDVNGKLPDCDSIQVQEGVVTSANRFCAIQALYLADSSLKLLEDSLLFELRRWGSDTLLLRFEALQEAWRNFREVDCDFRYGGYSTNAGACDYLGHKLTLTRIRIREMQALLESYR